MSSNAILILGVLAIVAFIYVSKKKAEAERAAATAGTWNSVIGIGGKLLGL